MIVKKLDSTNLSKYDMVMISRSVAVFLLNNPRPDFIKKLRIYCSVHEIADSPIAKKEIFDNRRRPGVLVVHNFNDPMFLANEMKYRMSAIVIIKTKIPVLTSCNS